MAIAFACPGCATPFNVTDDMAGKRAKCPKCTMIFTLPAAEPVAAASKAPAKQSAAASAGSFQETERFDPDRKSSRRSRGDDEDDRDEARPRSAKSRKAKGSPLPWILGLGGVALLLLVFCAGTITVIAVVAFRRDNPKGNNPPPPVNPIVQVPKPPVEQQDGPVQLKQGPGRRVQITNGRFAENNQLTAQDPFDPATNTHRCKLYQVDLQAGRTYMIEMTSPNTVIFDPYLRLEDTNRNVLAENDDIAFPNNLNSRIIWMATFTGPHVVIATSFRPEHMGAYTLSIRQTN
jgi:hypothetical protein